MNILCVIDSLGSGGAQRQLVGLALGFKKRGHIVSFLVYHEHDFFKSQLDQAKIPVTKIIEPNYLKRLLKMRQFIRKGNFDAVLSFLEAANFICEIAGLPFRKWKLIVGERSANPNITKSAKLRFYRWFHLLADYVVANSLSNINMIKKINPLLSDKKCKTIYNMVDLQFWKPDVENYRFREEGKVNLVVAASHSYIKNLNGLVDAVSLLKSEEKNSLKIHWYGSKTNDKSQQTAIEKIETYGLGHVFYFYEPTNQIHTIINQSDAIGLFSFYEGLPNVICEAMACGKPVVASSLTSLMSILSERENGFFCSPNDLCSIANALSKLVNSPKEELQIIGSNNREKAKNLFNPEDIIRSYLNLLS